MAEQLSLTAAESVRRIRVASVWYERPTEDAPRAHIRMSTEVGAFYQDTTLNAEGLAKAHFVAKWCGVDLVVAYDLREMVAQWEPPHG